MENQKDVNVNEVKEVKAADKKIRTSIDTSTVKGKMLAYSCMSDPKIKNDELRLTPFFIENYFIHEIEMTDEKTGEVTNVNRTVLLDPDGNTTSFVSGGAAAGLDALIDLFGPGPWTPAIPIKVKDVKTTKGFKTLNLVIQEDLYKG